MNIKNNKLLAWSIFGISAVLLATFSLVFTYQRAYAGKIYKNVYFSDVNLAGMTKSDAKETLKAHFATLMSSEIQINANNKTVKVKLADTGLSFDFDKAVDESYQIGRTGSFIQDLLFSSKTFFDKQNIGVSPYVDDTKYNEFLQIAVGQLNNEATDASLAIENGEVKMVPSTEGQVADTSKLIDQIIDLANNNTFVLDLDTQPVQPKITTADYENAKAQANVILGKQFTFLYTDKTYTPSKKEIGEWIDFQLDTTGKNQAVLNDSNIKAYLNKIAINFQINRIDKKISNADNSVIQEGKAGLYLDKDKTLSDLKSKVMNANQATIQVPLITYTEDPKEIRVTTVEGFVPGKFEGKYIDVDLTAQKLCRVDGNTLVDCFIISSGKPGMDTPTGTFTINDKSPRHWSNKYSMWLPWWQQFKTGGWGLHELPETATWKEVPDHLGTPISHGCVRLGVGPAETVYNWTEMGTIVYIHK